MASGSFQGGGAFPLINLEEGLWETLLHRSLRDDAPVFDDPNIVPDNSLTVEDDFDVESIDVGDDDSEFDELDDDQHDDFGMDSIQFDDEPSVGGGLLDEYVDDFSDTDFDDADFFDGG